MDVSNRLFMGLEGQREQLQLLRKNARDAALDPIGVSTGVLKDALRFIGIAEFVLYRDVESFKRNLGEAARIKMSLFERHKNGEPIAGSYVSMLSYKSLFDALAVGDMDLAQSLAAHMGGRDAIERKNDRPFDYVFGYALRAFVLNRTEEMTKWSVELAKMCAKLRNADFDGYCNVFEAIMLKDVTLGIHGIQQIATGHFKQSAGPGLFNGTVDEALCVWGVGAANLARARGLPIQAVPPLIPDELLIITTPQANVNR